MLSVIPVRTRAGRKRHAMPETGGVTTLCKRPIERVLIDDGFPDCKVCCAAIARLTAEGAP